jgi:hypothetical protein
VPSSDFGVRAAQLNRQAAMTLRTLTIAALTLTLSGCIISPFSSLADETHQIWDEVGPPPVDLASPKGFRVTPAQAHSAVTRGLPQKYAWYIYADKTSYFLVEHAPLLVPTSGYARKYGVQLDGTTGACKKRCRGALAGSPPDPSLERTRER